MDEAPPAPRPPGGAAEGTPPVSPQMSLRGGGAGFAGSSQAGGGGVNTGGPAPPQVPAPRGRPLQSPGTWSLDSASWCSGRVSPQRTPQGTEDAEKGVSTSGPEPGPRAAAPPAACPAPASHTLGNDLASGPAPACSDRVTPSHGRTCPGSGAAQAQSPGSSQRWRGAAVTSSLHQAGQSNIHVEKIPTGRRLAHAETSSRRMTIVRAFEEATPRTLGALNSAHTQ